jgi:hypothetical protein
LASAGGIQQSGTMTFNRSDQVVARVVAWHNRHPLANRITPDQVHSVGVVSLPFAVQGALPVAFDPGLVELERRAAIEEARAQVAPEAPARRADTLPLAADGATAEAAAKSTADAPTDAPSDAPSDSPSDASSDASPAFDAANASSTPSSILDRAVLEAARSAEPGPGAEDAEDAGAAFATPAGPRTGRVMSLPPRPSPWHPRTWWQRLRGRSDYRALFTEDFIAPLRPRRVAQWVAAHGSSSSALGRAAPLRFVMLDPQLRRVDDPATELDLQVATAAIGAGDQRLRVLVATDGSAAVLGPRHWSRPRVAVASGLAVSVMAAGVTTFWLTASADAGHANLAATASEAAASGDGSGHAAASALAAASAPLAGGSAPDIVTALSTTFPPRPAETASGTAAAPRGTTHADASQADKRTADTQTTEHSPADTPAAEANGKQSSTDPQDDARASPDAGQDGSSHREAQAVTHGADLATAHDGAGHVASETASAETATSTSSASSAPSAASRAADLSNVSPQRGQVPLQRLAPVLAESDRQALRVAGRSLRGEVPAQPVPPVDKAWALVTAPLPNKRTSQRAAAQLNAVARLQTQPMQAELLQAGPAWRAVCWPFPSAREAQKVQMALLDKGLRTEVVEF